MTETKGPGAPRRPGGAGGTDEALDRAFESLKSYDWGKDPQVLSAIEKTLLAHRDDADGRKELELRLTSVLNADVSIAARSFVCRKLSHIGSKDSVPALSGLLVDADLSHMARYALERMPCPEAVEALRGALSKADGRIKVGIINSIGVRRDVESTSRLIDLVDDPLTDVAAAAVAALGEIGTEEAARALLELQSRAPDGLRLAIADADLVCASRLRDAGRRDRALEVYKALLSKEPPDHIRYAAEAGRQSLVEDA